MSSTRSQLHIDLSGLMAAVIGDQGLAQSALDAVAPRAAEAVKTTVAQRDAGSVGFLDLPDDTALARRAMDFARDLPADIDTLVVLGIGGSSLGPQAVYRALAHPFDQLRPRAPGMPRRLFFPDNPDPATFAALLDQLDLSRTLFAVITKSGGTAETAAQFLVVAERLERALGPQALSRHVVAITDPQNGSLRAVVNELELPSFAIPPAVGGRFSVLSAVGLVPAAVAGLDVSGLLDGARAMRDRALASDQLGENPALMLATALHLHHVERGRPMVVVMPYADGLYSVGDWFRQLWAESLGKQHDLSGARVDVGPTPIAARGATDQHSMLQLFSEGPNDKSFIVMGVRERGAHIPLPAPATLAKHSAYGYLGGHDMAELLDAELRGTVASLLGRGRPTATITLERLDAAALGELFMLFEAATAFAGSLYNIDPYDQPGVEEAKQLAYASLGRPGYEQHADKLSAAHSDPRYVFEA